MVKSEIMGLFGDKTTKMASEALRKVEFRITGDALWYVFNGHEYRTMDELQAAQDRWFQEQASRDRNPPPNDLSRFHEIVSNYNREAAHEADKLRKHYYK